MTQKTLTLNFPLTDSKAIPVFIGISVLSFLVPFSLGQPQWLVGTTVNACLFLAAVFLPKKFFLPLVVLPSLGVLGRGIIFGPFTPFLVYFLPFIWLGNLILISSFKILREKLPHFKYSVPLFCAASMKFLFLLAAANLYFKFNLVPEFFLQAMGINQFLTALAGGIISLIIFNTYAKHHAGNQRTA